MALPLLVAALMKYGRKENRSTGRAPQRAFEALKEATVCARRWAGQSLPDDLGNAKRL